MQSKPQQNIISFHHVSLLVNNTEKALIFYVDILGLTVDSHRPSMAFSGAWLNLAGGGQIHLIELAKAPKKATNNNHTQNYGGTQQHLALQVTDLKAVMRKLDKAKINYSQSQSGRLALFCQDDSDNVIELLEVSPSLV